MFKPFLAFFNLCHRPYWTRVWIIQEVVKGQRISVHCGDESVDWDVLEELTKSLPLPYQYVGLSAFQSKDLGLLLSKIENTLMPLVWLRMQGELDLSLLLAMTCNSTATDPRDMIYALLGIATPSHGITVDYGKSLSELFTDTTRSMIQKTNSLQ